MFTELLESRARRQRRTGGMALSIVGHVAIIGFATAATVHGRPSAEEATKPVIIYFPRKPIPAPVNQAVRTTKQAGGLPRQPTIPEIVIDVPDVTLPTLPAIDVDARPTPDEFIVSKSGPGSRSGRPSGIWEFATNPPTSYEWRGSEALMHILASGKPRYPEVLRQNGVDGRVLVQFTVDTLGRVDMKSIRVLKSTHDLFTAAVRNALTEFRFRPAEVDGK